MISRCAAFGRILVKNCSGKQDVCGKLQTKRWSHIVSYRVAPPPHSKFTMFGAELIGAAMWWWIFWHLWHEYDHITGEFEYPCPSRWNNSELGIPADS